jgi:hypothetical protein
MKKSLFPLGVAFALVGVAQAAVLIDDFESYPKDNSTSMNGLGTWTVSNGTSTGNGEIAITTDSTFDLSTGAALIGGWDPDVASPTVLSSNGLTVGMFGSVPALFAIDFGFYDSTNANRDDYSISLTSTGGGNLLTIDLTPAANPNTFNMSFSSDFFAGIANWGTLDALDTAGNPYFQLQFQTWADGANMYYSLFDVNGGTISTGALTGTSLSDEITDLEISVDTAGGAGDGFLIVDNVSLVPEPSSALLGLLGASFAFLRRRRA